MKFQPDIEYGQGVTMTDMSREEYAAIQDSARFELANLDDSIADIATNITRAGSIPPQRGMTATYDTLFTFAVIVSNGRKRMLRKLGERPLEVPELKTLAMARIDASEAVLEQCIEQLVTHMFAELGIDQTEQE